VTENGISQLCINDVRALGVSYLIFDVLFILVLYGLCIAGNLRYVVLALNTSNELQDAEVGR
jgi:hypothetical protein